MKSDASTSSADISTPLLPSPISSDTIDRPFQAPFHPPKYLNISTYLVWTSFGIFLLSYYINCLMQVITDHNVPSAKRLPDIGQYLLPHLHFAWLCDIWLAVLYALTVLRFMFSPHRNVIFHRMLLAQSAIFLMRGLSIYITNLTVPLKTCQSTATGNVYLEALLVMIFYHRTCADILFSGHTATMTLLCWTWHDFHHREIAATQLPQSTVIRDRFVVAGDNLTEEHHQIFEQYREQQRTHRNLLRFLSKPIFLPIMWIYTLTGICLIIATRFHYTVDCFVGFLIASLLWKYYQAVLLLNAERVARKQPVSYFILFIAGGYGILCDKAWSLDTSSPLHPASISANHIASQRQSGTNNYGTCGHACISTLPTVDELRDRAVAEKAIHTIEVAMQSETDGSVTSTLASPRRGSLSNVSASEPRIH